MRPIKTILVPTDFSDASQYALDYAATIAKPCQASIKLLYVDDDITVCAPTTADEFREQRAAEHGTKLAAMVERLSASGVEATSDVLFGTAFVEIVRFAKDNDADLIAMATHGRTALVHMLLGSVAENVIRTSPCPVLSVRDPNQKFEMP